MLQIRSQVNVVVDKRSQQVCLDSIVGQNAFNLAVKIWPCHGQGGNQVSVLVLRGFKIVACLLFRSVNERKCSRYRFCSTEITYAVNSRCRKVTALL